MNLAIRLVSGLALSLAVASAPAAARDWRGGYHGGYRYYHHDRGIGGFGAFVLGAAVLGTVAAVASANDRDREARRYDDGDPRQAPQGAYEGGYGVAPYDDQAAAYDDRDARDPVEACSRAAEVEAQNDGGFARVTGIDRVDDFESGADVRGELELTRGSYVAPRRLSFTCTASYGQVTRLRLG